MQTAVLTGSPTRSVPRTAIDHTQLITAKQLREILGDCSEMHIWRLLNDQRYRALKFPRPIPINRRNYFRLHEVRRWIAARQAAAGRETQSRPKPPPRGRQQPSRAATA